MLISEMRSGAQAVDLEALKRINRGVEKPWFDALWVMVRTERPG